MHPHPARLWLLVSPWLVSGCIGPCAPQPAVDAESITHPITPDEAVRGRTVATVHNIPVGTETLNRTRGTRVPSEGSQFSTEEKRELLNDAIEEELLFQEAFRRGLYQEPSIRRTLVAHLLKAEVYDRTKLPEHTEEELRSWFDDHKDTFVVPERIHLQRIFLVPGASRDADATRELAQSLYAQATANPDSFPDLAREHSDGPLALRSGDAGFLSEEGRPEVPPEIVTRAFLLPEGTISEPFEQGGGWNLLRVPAKRPRVERSFEQVRAAIKRRLNEAHIRERRQEFVERLKRDAAVQIDTNALEAWRPPLTLAPTNRPPPKPAAVPPPADDGDEEEVGEPGIRDQLSDELRAGEGQAP